MIGACLYECNCNTIQQKYNSKGTSTEDCISQKSFLLQIQDSEERSSFLLGVKAVNSSRILAQLAHIKAKRLRKRKKYYGKGFK